MRGVEMGAAPGKQLFAERAFAVGRLVDPAGLQFGHDQIDERRPLIPGHTRRNRLKPSTSVSSTQAINSSATSWGEPTTNGERAPTRLRVARSPTLTGRSLRKVKFSTIDWIALLSTYCTA